MKCSNFFTVGISKLWMITLSTSIFFGCSKEFSFSPADAGNNSTSVSEPTENGGGGNNTNSPIRNKITESFSPQSWGGMVDILVIDDNSDSMYTEQTRMGSRFMNFIAGLNDVDWQLGITTTDLAGTGQPGRDGQLDYFKGTTLKYINANTPNAEQLFLNTMKRDETLACRDGSFATPCGTTNEQPLRAIMRAADLRNSANAGFFRDNADLAIVILSDEDENSDRTNNAMTAQAALNHLRQIFPEKPITAFGIIIQPGNSSCYTSNWLDGGASYGEYINNFVSLTGGTTGSICDTDYAQNLTNIGTQIRKGVLNSVNLAHDALPESVVVKFTPSRNITWRQQGRKIIFSAPVTDGTVVDVTYEYN